VQLELRRVGCLKAAVDCEWNGASQRSLSLFNQYARTKFDIQIPSIDALNAVKGKTDRVCPVFLRSWLIGRTGIREPVPEI